MDIVSKMKVWLLCTQSGTLIDAASLTLTAALGILGLPNVMHLCQGQAASDSPEWTQPTSGTCSTTHFIL